MWWSDQSELENAAEIERFVNGMQGEYFAVADNSETRRPSWLRGIGAVPLGNVRSGGSWGAILYIDSDLDPRRTMFGGISGVTARFAYDRLGPVPGLHVPWDVDDYQYSEIREPWWFYPSPGGLDEYPTRLRSVIRGTVAGALGQARRGARAHMLPFSGSDDLWQRLAATELDVPLPNMLFAYFVSGVKAIGHRVKDGSLSDYGSAGCVVECQNGTRVTRFTTTAGHAVTKEGTVSVRGRGWLPRSSRPGKVRHWSNAPIGAKEMDLALVEIDLVGKVRQRRNKLDVLRGVEFERRIIHAQYDGAKLGRRALRLYTTTTPLISDDNRHQWSGFLAHTGDRRRVGAKGDSGSAVVTADMELVGHLVGSTHGQGAIVQAAELENAWIPGYQATFRIT